LKPTAKSNRKKLTKGDTHTGSLKLKVLLAGYPSITAFAKIIGRSRVTVHRAWKKPSDFGPTSRLISERIK
jgi:hypothetical protein